jgi:hypothetical protein
MQIKSLDGRPAKPVCAREKASGLVIPKGASAVEHRTMPQWLWNILQGSREMPEPRATERWRLI